MRKSVACPEKSFKSCNERENIYKGAYSFKSFNGREYIYKGALLRHIFNMHENEER